MCSADLLTSISTLFLHVVYLWTLAMTSISHYVVRLPLKPTSAGESPGEMSFGVAATLVGEAKKAADGFGPLKIVLGVVSAVYTKCKVYLRSLRGNFLWRTNPQETVTVRIKIKGLPRIATPDAQVTWRNRVSVLN